MVEDVNEVEEDERERKINEELMKKFGFTSFGTSKGKDHTVNII